MMKDIAYICQRTIFIASGFKKDCRGGIALEQQPESLIGFSPYLLLLMTILPEQITVFIREVCTVCPWNKSRLTFLKILSRQWKSGKKPNAQCCQNNFFHATQY